MAAVNNPVKLSLLINAGADINLRDYNGDTALTIAGRR